MKEQLDLSTKGILFAVMFSGLTMLITDLILRNNGTCISCTTRCSGVAILAIVIPLMFWFGLKQTVKKD